MPTDTIKRLAEITDAALFERIATDVLRSADPKYRNLAHPGVNSDGKTVKAPLDNIGWEQSANGSRLIGVAHTTCEQQDIKGKWLHDPATVQPRKVGGKPTQPAGDLVKAISVIETYRATQPGLAATLALTTNRETPADVRVAVETVAASANIELDIWSVSRIAGILDTTQHGQFIRRAHLGTAAELVSVPLLLQMGTQSISDHLLLPNNNEIVVRSGISIGAGHMLVAGDSGMGKTTACATVLQQHIASGSLGIVLKNEYIARSTTIEEALEHELRRQNAELESGAGSKALLMSSTDNPFLLLVEDINRSDNPTAILEKVIGWALQESQKNGKEHASSWRLVCPVWPRYLESFLQRKEVFSIFNLANIESFTDEEGQCAVTKRAVATNHPMDAYRAASIAKRLCNDPLLISLHDLKSELNASDVIEQYVSTKLAHVASRMNRLHIEVESVVFQFVLEMFSRRKINPDWLEAAKWFSDQESTNILREVVSDGSVLRFSGTGEQLTIHARHDRVMDFLMARAIADRLKNGDLTSEYLHDPFFAESVGAGAVKAKLPISSLNTLMASSPIVAFFALKTAIESNNAYKDTAVVAIEAWLALPEVQAGGFSNRRFAALQVLAEIDSIEIILRLTNLFPKSDHRDDIFLSARFRNGDIGSGIAMLTMFDFGVTVAGRKTLLAHVKRQYGNNLVKVIEDLLVREDLNEKQRAGVLYLAGHIGSAISPRVIQTAWTLDGPKRDLQAHLWAAAQCCGAEAAETLGPVCDAWEALPEEENATLGQPAERLAADGISWEFRDHTPHNAVPYFVQRANQSKKLNWPITYMLRAVDHPDALEHLARWLSDRDIQSNGYSIWSMTLTTDWERQFREHGRMMSPPSKQRLLELAMDTSRGDDLRKRAFGLWELTISDGDVEIARSIEPLNVLYTRALWARARRNDESVTEKLAQKFEENPAYWLQTGRFIWSEEMTAALIPIIEQISKSKDDGGNDEYSAAEALDFLSPAVVEKIIIPLWEGLKCKSVFVQKLLQIATPKLLALVHQAITQSDSPKDLFKYYTVRIRTRNYKDDGLSRLEQMEALQPYLKMLELHDIENLWRRCNKHGWLNFRVSHLDPLMQQQPERNIYLPGDTINTEDLDRALNGTLMATHRWVEMQIERGAERATVFESMLAWLEKHQEVRALGIAGDIFSETANREEFELLLLTAIHRPNSGHILAATKFNVFRRSLL